HPCRCLLTAAKKVNGETGWPSETKISSTISYRLRIRRLKRSAPVFPSIPGFQKLFQLPGVPEGAQSTEWTHFFFSIVECRSVAGIGRPEATGYGESPPIISRRLFGGPLCYTERVQSDSKTITAKEELSWQPQPFMAWYPPPTARWP